MTKYKPTKVISIYGGLQKVYEFPNGYGASVVCHEYSYGGKMDLWEGAVIGKDGDICYTTPITDDVVGFMDLIAVENFLDEVAALN